MCDSSYPCSYKLIKLPSVGIPNYEPNSSASLSRLGTKYLHFHRLSRWTEKIVCSGLYEACFNYVHKRKIKNEPVPLFVPVMPGINLPIQKDVINLKRND